MAEPSTLNKNRAMIGKWNVDRYTRLIRWWVVSGAAVIVILVLLETSQEYILLTEAAVYVLCGWLVARRGGSRTEGLTAGVLAGLGLGLAASISRFILIPELFWAINIVRETLLTGLIAALVTVSVTLLINLRIKSTN